ncbi:D-alanyl-D-alanine carboxypeptidase/D-alanyl-D-alanine endopeptidase [Mycobacterium sp.]|uniref:D-alanyl-D-alanine carboxypeptidase/D-alanyl-D-alanine endopeptidase n=1 Tax=Mycobacterium sp. TaxID=1785 RepID=UPI002D5332F3|nr:D-alanyl-D-alanine carboxypeptidase/D-alanyl-D-alanine-endopeptidase [Mycobacterium sp.]HZA11978.1 D-alanyl-D-alanine carboxypeptidase/D-alanyl-D-alanine-endopeptidase [Mycobacterium sp.]
MRPTRWRRSTHMLIGVAVLALVAAVVAVAAMVTGGQSSSGASDPMPTPAPRSAKPAVVPVADTAPRPTPAGMVAALATPLANPDLGAVTGMVTDALTGTPLWERGSAVPMQPASTNKVLTAAAALSTLDRGARLTTTVAVADQRQPGLVVLVGAGDPTLSPAPLGQDTLYRDAARISDLADQVRRSGVTPTAVAVDTSAFSGPTMAPGWDPADIDGGDVAPIESVMVDGGRTQPLTPESIRSTTPALDAGRSLAIALGVDPKTVTTLNTPTEGRRQIASVQSPPLTERLRQMMNESDNVMAECIGREVAVATHRPASFAGAVEAVGARLAAAKVDMGGARLMDASGLSADDRLTARTLDGVVGAAAGPDQPSMRPLLDVLPIAGGSGTLSNRYTGTAPDAAAAGWLRAKTGSLTGTNTLAGIVTDVSGRVLTFALMSNNAGPTGRTAIDALAATLRSCGCGS